VRYFFAQWMGRVLPSNGSVGTAYRGDIDGLRALAVLLVIGYHVFPAYLPGGFLGVDIFFVISGFLISSITLREMREGRFSLLHFYARRARRIFPALILVLLAVLAFGWLVLLPYEYQGVGKHAAASAVFVPNFLAWRESGYFEVAAPLKPLLHLWSLGVEEQFYLAWPIFLLVAAKATRKSYLFVLLLSVASFCLALAAGQGFSRAFFFLPHYRAWEIGLGCLLGHWHEDAMAAKPPGRRTAAFFSISGLALIFAGLFFVDPAKPFSVLGLLPAVLGAFLLILAGPQALLNRSLLSWSWLTAIGKISYPLYLWHWPLLSFAVIVARAETAGYLPWVALAFPLAWLTHLFLERPIRKGNARSVYVLVPAMCVVLLVSVAAWHDKLTPRPEIARAEKLFLGPYFGGPFPNTVDIEGGKLLRLGKGSEAVLFLGDSHAQPYIPRLEKLVKGSSGRAKEVLVAYRLGCVPIPHLAERSEPECAKFLEYAVELASAPEVRTVVLTSFWIRGIANYLGRSLDDVIGAGQAEPLGAVAESLEAFLTRLKGKGKRVVVVMNTPFSGAFDLSRMVKRRLWGRWELSLDGMARSDWERVSGFPRSWLKGIAARAGADWIDPTDFLCSQSHCPAVDAAGARVYADFHHLSHEFASDQVTYLDSLVLGPARGGD
jgi:peptidoglycan/LPS O-acetylase OafA/YrhL